MASPGKYEIVGPLRSGAAPKNHLAFNRGVGGFRRLVMLRLLSEQRIADDTLPARLLAWARACAPFAHPYLTATYEPEVIDGKLYLATEFSPGATLAEIAEACKASNQRLPLGFLLRAARDAAFALHYAHTFTDGLGRRRPFVHTAFTDASVLVSYDGTTKVVDFAYPREARPSPLFASPEQVRGEALDGRSDLFSLGAVLHSLVAGQRYRYAEVMGRAPSKAEFPPLSEINSEASAQLDGCLMKALFPNPDSRYPTALDFARDLERSAVALLFTPEQSAALVQQLFSVRREQLKTLVAREEAEPTTGIRPPVPGDAIGEGPSQPTRRHLVPATADPAAAAPGPFPVATTDRYGGASRERDAITGQVLAPASQSFSEEDEDLGSSGAGRIDVIPEQALAPASRRFTPDPTQRAPLADPAAPTGLRPRIFDQVPPTGPMPAASSAGELAADEPLEALGEDPAAAIASEPTRTRARPTKKGRLLPRLFLALFALGSIALAFAQVLSPEWVRSWTGALGAELRANLPSSWGLGGQDAEAAVLPEDPPEQAVVELEEDAGAEPGEPDASVAGSSAVDAGDPSPAEADAGAGAAVEPPPEPPDAGVLESVKPGKPVKKPGKPGKKKRRR